MNYPQITQRQMVLGALGFVLCSQIEVARHYMTSTHLRYLRTKFQVQKNSLS